MLLTLALCVGVFSNAQQVDTLYISPNVSAEVDAFVQFNNGNPTTQDANFSQSGVLLIDAWTSSGQLKISRSLMKWDFSTIPTGSTIQSATLQLFHNTNSATGNSTEAGTNEAWVERITQAWDGATVAWSTQPPTTTVDRVQLPTDNPIGVRNIQSDVSVDLTNIVQHFMDNPNDQHGIKISLATEEFYRRRTYFSSDYTDPTKHPRLILEYTTPVMATPNLQPEYCDVELGLEDRIKSIRINGATSYEFRFDDGNGNVFTHVSTNNRVKLKNVVPLPEYGASYDVSVRASDGNTTTPYGSACQITIENIPAPGIDKTVNGRTDVLMDEALQADKVIGATTYEFEVTNIDDGYTENILSSNRNLKIKQLSEGAFYNTNYRVVVRAIVGANTGPYGQVSVFRTTNVVTETTQLKDKFITNPNINGDTKLSFKPIKYINQYEVVANLHSVGYDTIIIGDTNGFGIFDFPIMYNLPIGQYTIDLKLKPIGNGIVSTYGNNTTVDIVMACSATYSGPTNVCIDPTTAFIIVPNSNYCYTYTLNLSSDCDQSGTTIWSRDVYGLVNGTKTIINFGGTQTGMSETFCFYEQVITNNPALITGGIPPIYEAIESVISVSNPTANVVGSFTVTYKTPHEATIDPPTSTSTVFCKTSPPYLFTTSDYSLNTSLIDYQWRLSEGNFVDPVTNANLGTQTLTNTNSIKVDVSNVSSSFDIEVRARFDCGNSEWETVTYDVVQPVEPITSIDVISSDLCGFDGPAHISVRTTGSVTHGNYDWYYTDAVNGNVYLGNTLMVPELDILASSLPNGAFEDVFTIEVEASNDCGIAPLFSRQFNNDGSAGIQPIIIPPNSYCGGSNNSFTIQAPKLGVEYVWQFTSVFDQNTVDITSQYPPVSGLDMITYAPDFGVPNGPISVCNDGTESIGNIKDFTLEVYTRNCVLQSTPSVPVNETGVDYNNCCSGGGGGGAGFNIALAPNPTNNQLNVTIPPGDGSIATVDITDIYGVVQKSVQTYNLVETINVSNLPLGTYNVCVIKGNDMDIEHLQILP